MHYGAIRRKGIFEALMLFLLTTVTAIQTLYSHPKGISDGHFAIAMGGYARVKFEAFTQELDVRTTAYKRRLEVMHGKQQLAIDMVKRALKSGIYADYLGSF